MNTVQWIIILLIVVFFVALVLPSKYSGGQAANLKAMMEKKRLEEERRKHTKATCEKIGPCERECRYNSLNAEKDRYGHSADIDSQFMKSKDTVPNDYPPMKIGCCPYGKPLSRDLPMADVPMCMAVSSNDMRLHS